jgi:hypothetical protein
MVGLLEFVKEVDVFGIYVAGPLEVKVVTRAFKHAESCAFATINQRVVYVSVIVDSKRHE